MNSKSEDFDPGKTVVNKVAETTIASQLDSSQNIDVAIDSQVSQLAQGKLESLEIAGEKIIAFEAISLEKLSVSSGNIAVDLTQAIFGNLVLEQPGDFSVKIVFTPADCDRLLNSAHVRVLLESLSLKINNSAVNFYLQEANCTFNSQGGIYLTAQLKLNYPRSTKVAKFEIEFDLYDSGKAIAFKGGKYLESSGLDLDETVAVMNKISDLLYLRHFTTPDLTANITDVAIESQQLVLSFDLQLQQLPDSLDRSIKSVASEIDRHGRS